MGFFSSGSNMGRIPWQLLKNIETFDDLIRLSSDIPVMLFKHSTRCSISVMAKQRLESKWDFSSEEIIPVYLDLLSYRNVSNEIADRLQVTHQSPQVILMKNGRGVYHASHNQISVGDLKQNL